MQKHVFIIGSKGIPASYGGFETFVDRLTSGQVNKDIVYHVACIATRDGIYDYNGVECFNVKIPNVGPAKAVLYDVKAANVCIKYLKEHPSIEQPVLYVLACRLGPFFKQIADKWQALGGVVYVNPDGHEWKRAKWSAPIRTYWKWSERLMVKRADLLICDSKEIEKYIQKDYERYSPDTRYISYGTDINNKKICDSEKYERWASERGLRKKEYYLIVGRFVPENNFETIILEFMKSDTPKKLAIITTSNDKLMHEIQRRTNFRSDERIVFVGTVYDKELLGRIRENAYGYIHGHEVGGTNPSLLEALGTTDLNLLFQVGFNYEVAGATALYWTKDSGALAGLINRCENMSSDQITEYGNKAKKRMKELYTWDLIIREYEDLFTNNKG